MEGEPKKRRGPKPKEGYLTVEKAKQILHYIELGHTNGTAISLVGYSPQSENFWRRMAKVHPDSDEPYHVACRTLVEGLKPARAKCKENWLSKWRDADDWKAAQAFLVQRFPNEFGHQVRSMNAIVDGMIAVKNRDIGKLMKMFGAAKSKTLMKLLQSFNLVDDVKPSVEQMTDEMLAKVAEVGFVKNNPEATETTGGTDAVADNPPV